MLNIMEVKMGEMERTFLKFTLIMLACPLTLLDTEGRSQVYTLIVISVFEVHCSIAHNCQDMETP
jgi:hypothetical protein